MTNTDPVEKPTRRSPYPPLSFAASLVLWVSGPALILAIGGLATGFHANSVGLWIAGGIVVYIFVVTAWFRGLFFAPLRFHDGGPPQDAT